jgi:hypothetical protein
VSARAAVVLLTEAAFTLLAVPVLARLDPWRCRCTRVGSPFGGLGVLGLTVDGPLAIRKLQDDDVAAAGRPWRRCATW